MYILKAFCSSETQILFTRARKIPSKANKSINYIGCFEAEAFFGIGGPIMFSLVSCSSK